MDDRALGEGGEVATLEPLAGGTQNQLFRVSRPGFTAAIRLPGFGADEARLKAFRRELTLLRALHDTDVPHARLIDGDGEGGAIGTPFYVMDFIDGWSPMNGWPDVYDAAPEPRHSLAFELVGGAASLANVDWKGVGLEGFGRPDDFHDRQVARWSSFLAKHSRREIPGAAAASAWLSNHRPRHWEPGIMHGDYQFANVMFANDVPARLAAIIDWEMTTIGDPLVDLAWALMAWSPEGDDMPEMRFLDLERMPDRDLLLEHYERLTGRSTEDIDYYVVLARWKMGAVLEMGYTSFLEGKTDDPEKERWGVLVLELMRKAAELAASSSLKPVSA